MDGAPVVKAKRIQRGRTRAGCATCRLRRVKCDELKPRCFRCVKADRVCEWEVIKGFKQVSLDGDGPLTIKSISIKSPGTGLEQRGFEFFTRCTAPSLSGFFPNEFWERTVLQAGYELPSLRHAVVAIGAVHEQFVSRGTTMGGDADETFALKQYNYSVQALQKEMAIGKCSVEVALICCALYISFDSLRGMTSSAVMHLHNGIKMLQSMHESDDKELRPKIAGSLTDLRRLMSRLASQINSDMQDPGDPANDREDTISILADSFGRLLHMHPLEPAVTFSTFEEARDHLYSFINGHLYHYYLRSLYYGSANPAQQAHLEIPIATLQEPILTALNSWSSAFDRFLATKKTSPGGLSANDIAAAALLQMHYQISHILIVGQIIPDEHGHTSLHTSDVFKQYSHNFGEALMLIESLILPQASPSPSTTPTTPQTPFGSSASPASYSPLPGSASGASPGPQAHYQRRHSEFYPDCGVVPMLFFIAMKCGDKRLRKKATELLRVSHRREGTWDSETCLRIVEYNIAKQGADKEAAKREMHNGSSLRRVSDGSVVPGKSPESTSTGSPDAAIDTEVVLRDEKARRYIEAGKEEAARLQRSIGRGGSIKHSLLYL